MGLITQYGVDSELLVMKTKDRFDDVRKRTVPDVVKQRGDPNSRPVLIADLIFRAKPVEDPCRKMKRPQTMRKPRMLGRLISKIGKPKLPNPPEPLKFGSIDKTRYKVAFRRPDLNPNDVMN